jgi:hypothetical protein
MVFEDGLSMKANERKMRAKRVLVDLDNLREEWMNFEKANQNGSDTIRRERYKLLETELSVLRMMQAEDRLIQQVAIGLISFAGGATVAIVTKWILTS